MDSKTKKLLASVVHHHKSDWLETGKKSADEKFFGLFTKKNMSTLLLAILLFVILADAGIYYLINYTK